MIAAGRTECPARHEREVLSKALGRLAVDAARQEELLKQHGVARQVVHDKDRIVLVKVVDAREVARRELRVVERGGRVSEVLDLARHPLALQGHLRLPLQIAARLLDK